MKQLVFPGLYITQKTNILPENCRSLEARNLPGYVPNIPVV